MLENYTATLGLDDVCRFLQRCDREAAHHGRFSRVSGSLPDSARKPGGLQT
jgi:hypothetical protein